MCLIAALWEHMDPPFRALVKIFTTTIWQQFLTYFLRMNGMFSLMPWTETKSREPSWSLGWRTRTISSSSSLLKVLKRSSVMKKILIESVSLRSTSDPSLHFTLPTFTFYSYTLCTYVYSLLYGFKVCKYTQMKSCEKQIINI